MSDCLIFAIPSKGRLMDEATATLARAGLVVRKTGNERGYRGEIAGISDVEIAFVSAGEIARQLRSGQVHLGITGEDLVREEMPHADQLVEWLGKLGFGHADVVVAVPNCWLDVATMANLRDAALAFHRAHGRRMRVATKYMNVTRGYFKSSGVADYRIVESLGATEGTPAAGTADLIVDITSTGSTLRANGLKVLTDGPVLRSEANLLASRQAAWSAKTIAARERIVGQLRLARIGAA